MILDPRHGHLLRLHHLPLHPVPPVLHLQLCAQEEEGLGAAPTTDAAFDVGRDARRTRALGSGRTAQGPGPSSGHRGPPPLAVAPRLAPGPTTLNCCSRPFTSPSPESRISVSSRPVDRTSRPRVSPLSVETRRAVLTGSSESREPEGRPGAPDAPTVTGKLTGTRSPPGHSRSGQGGQWGPLD